MRDVRFKSVINARLWALAFTSQAIKKPQSTNSQTDMDDSINIDNRGDFGLWAIEVAKQIVS
ncbi:hypothetical protein PMI07_006660 [Rhizobium sp. CF080]|nr:hypothetical protein PMI07_006660 [Rhizobium sp. CF080]